MDKFSKHTLLTNFFQIANHCVVLQSWLQKTFSRSSSATKNKFLTEMKILKKYRKFYKIEKKKQKLFPVK